jgi:hypothetical protein
MDKLVKNKLAMYKSVKTILMANQAEWSPLQAFTTSVQSFTTLLASLEQSGYQQNLALVGVSAVKNAKRAIVVDKAYALSSALAAYAVVNNDVELVNQMKIAKYDLEVASKSLVLVLVDRILSRASDFVGQLDSFGVTQASIDELVILRNELDGQLGAARNAIIDRKGQTLRIKSLIKEIDIILKLQLDKLMIVLKEDHLDFFIDYKNARMIIDYGNRSAQNPERDDGPPKPTIPDGSDFEDLVP